MKWFETTFRAWEFPANNHSVRLAEALNKQRIDGTFCDITIRVQNETFQAHRGVLCAASEYFRSLLDGSFKEHGANEIDLSEAMVDPATFVAILDYVYTGRLSLDGETYEKILSGVSYLLLEDACQLVASFLLDNLVLENCLEIMQIADRYNLRQLVEVTNEILVSRLHDYFIHENRLINVPIQSLMQLKANDDFVHVASEDLLAFLQSYIQNYVSCKNEEERSSLGSYEELIKFFRTETNCHQDIFVEIFEKFLKPAKNLTDVEGKIKATGSLTRSLDDVTVYNEEQEALTIVHAELQDTNEVVLTIHAYLVAFRKWTKLAEVCVARKHHRTFKDFIGIMKNGELVFSTAMRVAFVHQNGSVRFINNYCLTCSAMECRKQHTFFCYRGCLFVILESRRGGLLHILSYNEEENQNEWLLVGKFLGDSVMTEFDIEEGRDPPPLLTFHVHVQKDCTWIVGFRQHSRYSGSDTVFVKPATRVVAKLWKLGQVDEDETRKVMSEHFDGGSWFLLSKNMMFRDVESSLILEHTGAQDCTLKSTCNGQTLHIQPFLAAPNMFGDRPVLYHSGPMYTCDLTTLKWTSMKASELNLDQRNEAGCLERKEDVYFIADRENVSIAPSKKLPLTSQTSWHKTDREQVIRGRFHDGPIDMYLEKVYGVGPEERPPVPSSTRGAFYQVCVLGPLMTELRMFDVERMMWWSLEAPPVDHNIMHVNMTRITMADIPADHRQNNTIKSARFVETCSQKAEDRPFNGYLLGSRDSTFSSAELHKLASDLKQSFKK